MRWGWRGSFRKPKSDDMETPNPWFALKDEAPYVLREDGAAIEAYNKKANADYYIHAELVPEPFFGNIGAPLVVLLLNPGFGEDDRSYHANPVFRARLFSAMRSTQGPHFHLVEGAEGPGAKWWLRVAGRLMSDLGREFVAANLLAVQFFPYKSSRFAHGHVRVPSQAYGFTLVEKAMKRGAYIVGVRGRKLWTEAVPSLADYGRITYLKNPRNASLTPGNLTVYNEILQHLKEMKGS